RHTRAACSPAGSSSRPGRCAQSSPRGSVQKPASHPPPTRPDLIASALTSPTGFGGLSRRIELLDDPVVSVALHGHEEQRVLELAAVHRDVAAGAGEVLHLAERVAERIA